MFVFYYFDIYFSLCFIIYLLYYSIDIHVNVLRIIFSGGGEYFILFYVEYYCLLYSNDFRVKYNLDISLWDSSTGFTKKVCLS